MLRRIISVVLIVWALGFVWFAIALPRPLEGGKSAAVVVPTGGAGRIDRGLEVLEQGLAPKLFVSGVDREVRPVEFAVEYKVSAAIMACCVTLGFDSVDTRSNGLEISRWLAANKIGSVRLVTSDWHMRRAAWELRHVAPGNLVVIEDAIPTRPSLRTLFLEYHKLLARRVAALFGG